MDAIEIISNDVSAFLSGNDTYNTYKDQWTYLMESYMGGEEYKSAQNLVRYQLETNAEYSARVNSTPLQNHCSSVIGLYTSFLFKENPKRNFGNINNLPELTDFMYDADMDGRSFNAFMKDVATYSSIFGHVWIIVAKPDMNAATRADEMSLGVRPYVNMMSPLTVLDWNWKRSPNGKYELDYFKYIEDVNGNVVVIKEWTNELIITTIVDNKEKIISEKIVEVNGLGKIPAVIAYNKRNIVRGIGISDIADIADAQRFIYNATSEIDQSIRLDSHPSLVKTPETIAGTGAGAIIHMPEQLDPGLKPYILDHSGASVDKILATIQQTIESIDKMANTGAVRTNTARTSSGVAMETEFQMLNARLSEKADGLELAEEQIWKLWSEYQGYAWDGIIDYPDNFNIRDRNSDLDFYLKASTAPVQSPYYKKEVQKSIAKVVINDDNETIEEVLDEIDNMEEQPSYSMPDYPHLMMDPTTGKTQVVNSEADHTTLMQQGFVEAES
jgi:hypothetical protein|tara:strand:+ start:2037 stop:3536 length:1500 start_codon:yes stop_codon:yes gene_type:complete